VVIARRESDLGTLARNSRWLPVAAPPGARVWTDDFADVLGAFKWW